MKPRHAAALALCGWYLLEPIPDHKTNKTLYEAPLAYWETEGSFDRAVDCEQMRKGNVELMSNLRKKSFRPHTDQSPGSDLGLQGALAAKCIATDDPRLKEK